MTPTSSFSSNSSNPLTCSQETRRTNRCYLSLACSIGSISLACGSLLQIPNTTDRVSLHRGLFLTSLGFIYFVSLTDFCNKYFLETQRGLRFRQKYRLMISDVMEITNKIVSSVQAFFSFLVGFVVCKSTCSKSFVYASHFLMEAYAWFGTAYFMYDIWSMYKGHTQTIADKLKRTSKRLATNGVSAALNSGQKNGSLYEKRKSEHLSNGTNENVLTNGKSKCDLTQHSRHHEDAMCDFDSESKNIAKSGKLDFIMYMIRNPVMMIHHIFIGTFGLLVVTYIRGGGHCIYSYMFMMEFSTPFVSIRSILSTMGLKETRIYVANGLLMLGTFFICRVFMWPYVMWQYSIAIDATLWEAISGLPRGCIISILILFLPQVYWFYLMVKGALKVFFPPNKTKSTNLHHNGKLQERAQQKETKNNNLSPNGNDPIEISHSNKTIQKSSSNGSVTYDVDIITKTATTATATPLLGANAEN